MSELPVPAPVRPLKPLRLALALLGGLCGLPAQAAAELEVTQLSIEALMDMEVTTVSRKTQRLTDTAAAAFVLTADDIQRSGATSIPEALRAVPGLQVARISSSHWAVSARGFNGRFANKLLVLVDGHSVYSPLYSGVFWEAEDLPLEDIDRIEVIRGSGAALWGANAVNGIINIITRSARRTQDTLVTALAGDENRSIVTVRHGARVDDDTHFRLWARASDRKAALHGSEQRGADALQAARAGFRLDRESDATQSRLIGQIHDTSAGQILLIPQLTAPYVAATPTSQVNRGTHLLGRHEWTFGDGSQGSLQGYIDQSHISLPEVLTEDRSTVDLDFQHRLSPDERQDVIWGLGYRRSSDHIRSAGVPVDLRPERRTAELFSAFVHDEITVMPGTWKVVIGSKFEQSTYSGLEIQPQLRSLWSLSPTQSVWAAVSRAARTPSRAELGVNATLAVLPPMSAGNPTPMPLVAYTAANPDLDSESVVALELGYRTLLAPAVSLDVAAFHGRYRDLRAGRSLGTEPVFEGGSPYPSYLRYNSTTSNSLKARETGVEVALDWHVTPSWRLQSAWTWLDVGASRNGDPANDASAIDAEGTNPRNQLSLRSSLDLGPDWQVDGWLRHVTRLPATRIAAYTELDLRLAWRVTPRLELSLAGQNLLHRQHAEYASDQLPSQDMQIPRSVHLKARLQF
ncbi:iron complex outermembrane receptor protein [Sphaerotilus hippei]|uniref:Iron complex outermembrane receptor protein n=1 Tax=Sphaerotilus hippei TaxID=744406 RepID=A0A318GVE6_9BURK|nr:TonB-dependent receptor [Sphaerotilus hippei]PXW93419.1 iron complex outermembrane receptor protein [Sphaerotilus hippei]